MPPSIRESLRWLRRFGRRRVPRIVRQVHDDALTYLDIGALENLYDRVVDLERRRVEGILIEAGCALGGSAIVMASAKAKDRPFYIYDVFAMIPAPSERDGADVLGRYEEIRGGRSQGIGGGKYYGYEENLLEKVGANFVEYGLPPAENNVHFVRGLFQDVLHPPGPVALAHIDGDWYDSVTTCLERICPALAPGGQLVIDDYDAWSGCRQAVDDYFSDRRDAYQFVKTSRLNVLKR